MSRVKIGEQEERLRHIIDLLTEEYGADRARDIVEECLEEAGITDLTTAQDLIRFGRILSRQGNRCDKIGNFLMKEGLGRIVEKAFIQLHNIFGQEKAQQIVQGSLEESELSAVTSPQELLRFGLALVRRGGFSEVIGRSLKVQALLEGARLEQETEEGRRRNDRRDSITDSQSRAISTVVD